MHARYTEYLRDLIQSEQVKPLLDKALSTYPLYASEKVPELIPSREELNKKILNHYKYREIGFETVGRFLDELEITMCEIMPMYNERFKTVEIMAELPSPFDNVDVTETFKQTTAGTSESEGTAKNTNTGSASSDQKSNGKSIDADTPQNTITIGTKDIASVDYGTNAQWSETVGEGSSEHEDTSESESTGKTTTENTVEHTMTKKGNQGVNTYAHDMNEFRTSIIDVVEEIVNDSRLAELFMMVY